MLLIAVALPITFLILLSGRALAPAPKDSPVDHPAHGLLSVVNQGDYRGSARLTAAAFSLLGLRRNGSLGTGPGERAVSAYAVYSPRKRLRVL
jgi:hypothetical protein